jgi:hypothetical protein
MRPLFPLLLLLAAAAGAQTRGSFIVPSTNPLPRPGTLPFAGVPERFQQWYAFNEIKLGVDHPVRIIKIEFKALAGGGTQAAQLDMELALALGTSFPASQFDSNLTRGKVVVAPRATYALSATGAWPLAITFAPTNQFVWDGRSSIILDVKLYGNGLPNNPPLNYDFEYTVTGTNKVERLWANGNPDNQTIATNQQHGWGITTRFTFEEGVTVEFGDGCPGDGGFVPRASTSGGLPFAGNVAWTHELRQAPSQRAAALVLGTSDKMWGSINLPLDLGIIGGVGCSLLVEWAASVPRTTVGGGAGSGAITLPLPIPPFPDLSGKSLFTQWIIVDPNASNGLLTVSQGLWTTFG